MTDEDTRGTLERVGERFDFSEYEVEAYLATLQRGRLTAAELAELTDIPQPRVYDTVRSLASKGVVELHESRPMEVVALDPRDVFADVRTAVDDLVTQLEAAYTAPAPGDEAVTLVKSRSTIRRHLRDVVESAEYELLLSLSPALLGEFEEALRAARESGVTIDLLLSPAADVPDAEAFDYGAVATTTRARRGVTTPIVAVADGRYTVYASRDALTDRGDRYGVVFDRSELGFLVTGFLLTVVWTSATTLQSVTEDRPFPRRYASVRRFAAELGDAEGPLYVAVRGRDVQTGDPREVTGRISGISIGTTQDTASISVETADGVVDVGGRTAALEDVEAHELVVDRDAEPSL